MVKSDHNGRGLHLIFGDEDIQAPTTDNIIAEKSLYETITTNMPPERYRVIVDMCPDGYYCSECQDSSRCLAGKTTAVLSLKK